MSKIKIFSVYHRPYEIFRSDCIEPIQVGCFESDFDLGILKDDTGENISAKNGGYCELTAQYWVWKNYLPSHPNVEYVGFCHYRRYMDFWNKNDTYEQSFYNFRYIDKASFASSLFPKCNEQNIVTALSKDADVILPEAYVDERLLASILNLYKFSFGGTGINECVEVIKEDYPDWAEDFCASMNSKSAYHCLTFLMKREVFERYARWMFEFLFKVESKLCKKSFYSSTGRLEGYLGELFFNMWLQHEIRVNDLSVSECGGVMLDSPLPQGDCDGFCRFQKLLLEMGAWIKAELWSRSVLNLL